MAAWVDGINAFSAIWAEAMLRVLWQGGLALLAVALLCRLAPRIPAHVQCWLWRLAYLKLFIAMLGIAPVELPLLPPGTGDAPSVARTASLPAYASPVPVAPAPGFIDGSAYPSLIAPEVGLFGWVALFWLVVFGCWAGRIRKQYCETHRIRTAAAPVEDPAVLSQAHELSLRLGLSSVPEVLVTEATRGPFLVGVLRPAVVLPHTLVADGDPEDLRLVLAHELGHLKRRDLPWTWLPTLAQGLFPFHPLVWWAQREWTVAVETACDELVLRETAAPPARYARMLLDTATRFGGDTQLRLTTVGVVGSCRSLRRRLQMMHYVRPLSRRRQRLMSATLVAVGAITLVPWRVVASPAAPAPAAPAPATPAPTVEAPLAAPAPVVVRERRRARAARRRATQPIPATPANTPQLAPQPLVVPAAPRAAAVPSFRSATPPPVVSAPARVSPPQLAPAPLREAPRPSDPFAIVPAPPTAAPALATVRAGKRAASPFARPVDPPTAVAPPRAVVPEQLANPFGAADPAPEAANPPSPAEPGVPFLKDLPFVGRLFRIEPPATAAAEPAPPQATNNRRNPLGIRSTPDPNALPPADDPAEASAGSVVEVFSLRHIYVTDLQHLLQSGSGLPGGIGRLAPDTRSNSLVIQGSEAGLKRLKAAIRLLDVPMKVERGRFRITIVPANAKADLLRLSVLELPGAQDAEVKLLVLESKAEGYALELEGSNLWLRQAMALAARMEMGLGKGSTLREDWMNRLTPSADPNAKTKGRGQFNDFRPTEKGSTNRLKQYLNGKGTSTMLDKLKKSSPDQRDGGTLDKLKKYNSYQRDYEKLKKRKDGLTPDPSPAKPAPEPGGDPPAPGTPDPTEPPAPAARTR